MIANQVLTLPEKAQIDSQLLCFMLEKWNDTTGTTQTPIKIQTDENS